MPAQAAKSEVSYVHGSYCEDDYMYYDSPGSRKEEPEAAIMLRYTTCTFDNDLKRAGERGACEVCEVPLFGEATAAKTESTATMSSALPTASSLPRPTPDDEWEVLEEEDGDESKSDGASSDCDDWELLATLNSASSWAAVVTTEGTGLSLNAEAPKKKTMHKAVTKKQSRRAVEKTSKDSQEEDSFDFDPYEADRDFVQRSRRSRQSASSRVKRLEK